MNDIDSEYDKVPKNVKVPQNDAVRKNVKVPKNAKDDAKAYDLTHRLGAKVMFLATTIMAMAMATMANFSLDDHDGLWEIACALHSWLTEAAQKQGLKPRRINLETGYDLYKKETWEHLRALRKKHRPKRGWWSLPCTYIGAHGLR